MRIAELASLPDETFLREAYRLVLGRDIDTSGLEGYKRRLARGARRESVLVDLARSAEARARFAPPALLELPDEAFVDSAYVRFLGRNADPDGMRNYLSQLGKHGDRIRILRALGGSQEARRHDPVGWAFRHELNDLIRRETSFLGWRKRVKAGRGRVARGSSQQELDLMARELMQAQREENALLKDQIIMLTSALEGVSLAQRHDTARIAEIAASLASPPKL